MAPFELIAAQGVFAEQPSARSRRPADDAAWHFSKPYSFWDTADFGSTIDLWAAFPKLGASRLPPNRFPRDNAGLASSYPGFIGSAAQVCAFLKTEGAFPPPPVEEESSWAEGRAGAPWRNASMARGAGSKDRSKGKAQSYAELPVLAEELLCAAFQRVQ